MRENTVLTYSSYLALEDILAAQRPVSESHDETLFIIVHQVYELWFKQLLHEFSVLQLELAGGFTAHAMRTFHRVLKVMKLAVTQMDVMETMTPFQFAAFRGRLGSSSGFQSAQFREIEAMLGRRDERMLLGQPEDSPARARIEAAMSKPSLYDSLLTYLYLRGYEVPQDRLHRDVRLPLEPSEELQALLLRVYRDDTGAAQLCERFVDLDEGVQEWRYRHLKMVERIIGARPGTGGSSGGEYLRGQLAPSFPDLWAARSRL
ncbi:MAG: tryptophan 2,3-dioxygenase [Nonomuraea sp.]|nr:tryptophan 2,3-dioxygenase [Nonomuraea sp.]NUP63888.1 tryptophan 2,3-dioxygenase [Nonomuraea sp.]NUP76577.1 tryptophan 2,3-dioxygenase [Nonomuraea sp.]NUS06145.1 tryptophan 2,3-dioxygenase [Nonomuraea sp.]NUT43157.1 tryptophan 2,3-dioxygenase [Thermoactinospora sp.]